MSVGHEKVEETKVGNESCQTIKKLAAIYMKRQEAGFPFLRNDMRNDMQIHWS